MVSWDYELQSSTVEEDFNKFHSKLCTIIDTYAPEKEKKISAKKVVQDPWITRGILTNLSKQKKNILAHAQQ